MTTSLERAMLEVLQSVASPEEINTLTSLLDEMSHGHIVPWFSDFICEIIILSKIPLPCKSHRQN